MYSIVFLEDDELFHKKPPLEIVIATFLLHNFALLIGQ